MSLAGLLALLIGVALTAYALVAGPDFGAGVLDLLLRRRTEDRAEDRAEDRTEDRAAIATAIGPLWEANHVWLIFAITILFSAFPVAFSALGTALLAPLATALLAIAVRGAALGLRSGVPAGAEAHARLSRLFGAASAFAPFAFGLVAGGLAQASTASAPAGARPGASAPSIPWSGPFAIVVGVLAVCLCVQLSASFMAATLARERRLGPAERFRRRTLQAGAGTLLTSTGALLVADAAAHPVFARLTGAALPVLLLAVSSLTVVLLAAVRRRYRLARAASLLGGAGLLWGWFIAQSPHLVGPLLTIRTAAATPPALTAVAIASGAVLVAVTPAFSLLFSMFARPARR